MSARPRVLFISHEASRSGAPMQLLHLLRWLRTHASLEFDVLLKRGGPLEAEFRAVADNVYLRVAPTWTQRWTGRMLSGRGNPEMALYRRIAGNGYGLIYVNTVASCEVALDLCRHLRAPLVLHVHELEALIRLCGVDDLHRLVPRVSRFVVPSKPVAENLVAGHGVAFSRMEIIHGFAPVTRRRGLRDRIRAGLGIPRHAFVAGGCGAVAAHKGPDLFLDLAEVALSLSDRSRPLHFVWFGAPLDETLQRDLDIRAARPELEGRVLFPGARADTPGCFEAFDAFLLTSREEAFSLASVENAMLGNPVLCFDGPVGFAEFVDGTCGASVSAGDVGAMAAALIRFYRDAPALRAAGEEMRRRSAEFDVERCAGRVLEVIEATREA